MRSPETLPPVYDNRPSLRTRMAAVTLSLAIVALVIATLIAMGMLEQLPGGKGERLVAIRFSENARKASAKAVQHVAAAKSAATVAVPQPVPSASPSPKIPPIKMINMSSAEFAASDISKLGKSANAAAGSNSGNGAAQYGPGEGPGGARLYNAEWYREPTHAEIAGYVKSGAPPGSWATIACKTIDHFHVDDCRQLDESPIGSGLSRALRQAAWQFLVRPPRIDGKPIIGAWVRIRLDFTRSNAPERAEQPGADDDQNGRL